MKKEIEAKIEKIVKESQVHARIAKANETVFVRMSDKVKNVGVNLELDPHRRQVYTENNNSTNPE